VGNQAQLCFASPRFEVCILGTATQDGASQPLDELEVGVGEEVA
jgi:hypothetical protein